MVKHSVHTLVFRSLKQSHDMFIHHEGLPVPEDDLAYVYKYPLGYIAVELCDLPPSSLKLLNYVTSLPPVSSC